MAELTDTDIREHVRERYAAAATAAAAEPAVLRAAPSRLRPGHGLTDKQGNEVFGAGALRRARATARPTAAVEASLGCGVPTAVADLHEGETVLDLGSGAGADVLISARRVGAERQGDRPRHDRRDARAGARERRRRPASTTSSSSRATSRRSRCPTTSVDVVISNCVINLSADKRQGAARGGARAAPGRALRGLGRDRRRRHGRGHARGHAAVDRLHRRRAHARASSSRRSRDAGLTDVEITRDPPRARARQLGDRARPQARGLHRADARCTRAYPLLLALGALDAAGYSVIVPVAPGDRGRTREPGPRRSGCWWPRFPPGWSPDSRSPARSSGGAESGLLLAALARSWRSARSASSSGIRWRSTSRRAF